MNKEELDKEAQSSFDELDDWCVGDDWSIEESYKNGYSNGAEPREKRIAELEEQIENMKCCGNCENGELSAHEEPCLHCQRCFASKDVTDQENVKDNWEAIKEIKEK